jgi:hypothetical protein
MYQCYWKYKERPITSILDAPQENLFIPVMNIAIGWVGPK